MDHLLDKIFLAVIVDIINYYQWQLKINFLNQDYHQQQRDCSTYLHCPTVTLNRLDNGKFEPDSYLTFNKRTDTLGDTLIHHLNNVNIIERLPANYWYSSTSFLGKIRRQL